MTMIFNFGTDSNPSYNAQPIAPKEITRTCGRYYRIVPTYQDPWLSIPLTTSQKLAIDISGVISGTVKEGKNPIPYSRVILFYRPTNLIINFATTDKDGKFTFTGLDKSSSNYYVIAFDDKGTLAANALIFDKVTPA